MDKKVSALTTAQLMQITTTTVWLAPPTAESRSTPLTVCRNTDRVGNCRISHIQETGSHAHLVHR